MSFSLLSILCISTVRFGGDEFEEIVRQIVPVR